MAPRWAARGRRYRWRATEWCSSRAWTESTCRLEQSPGEGQILRRQLRLAASGCRRRSRLRRARCFSPAQAKPRMVSGPSVTLIVVGGPVMDDFTGMPSITSSSAGLAGVPAAVAYFG